MKKHSIVLVVLALVAVVALTLFSVYAFRHQFTPTYAGGEPFHVMAEAPNNYPFNSQSGFTIFQVMTKGERNGRSLIYTITRFIRPDHSDLQLIEYDDGQIDLRWHTPEGRRFSWKTGDAIVTDHGIVKIYVPGPAEFNEFKVKGKLFVIYHNLLCSITNTQEGAVVYSPEISGLPLWEERFDEKLQTVALKRGAPDEARWNAVLTRIPATVWGGDK
jgi:hypothetical protein